MAALRFVRVTLDYLEVNKPDDMSKEPGSAAEWRYAIIFAGSKYSYSDDGVVYGSKFRVDKTYLFDSTDPRWSGAVIHIFGYEDDDSSDNDPLPEMKITLNKIRACLPTTLPQDAQKFQFNEQSRDFQYTIYGSAQCIDGSPWYECSPRALVDKDGFWTAGRAVAVAEVADKAMIIGFQSGGLWLVDQQQPANQSVCLSNQWNEPDVTTIGQHPIRENEALVASHEGVSDTVVRVARFDAGSRRVETHVSLGTFPTEVTRIAQFAYWSIRNIEIVVAATDGGIIWARVAEVFGTTPYRWTRAVRRVGRSLVSTASENIKYHSVSASPNTLLVGVVSATSSDRAIATASFTNTPMPNLVLRWRDLTPYAGFAGLHHVSVGCASRKPASTVYVHAYAGKVSQPLVVSTTSGDTWSICGTKVIVVEADGTEVVAPASRWVDATESENHGNEDCRQITVSPDDDSIVVVTGLTTLVTNTSGALWWSVRGTHLDAHSSSFGGPGKSHFIVPTDGGISVVKDATRQTLASYADRSANEFLPTLMLSRTDQMFGAFYGNFGTHPTDSANKADFPHAPVVVAGLQDNGTALRYLSSSAAWGTLPGFSTGDGTIANVLPSTLGRRPIKGGFIVLDFEEDDVKVLVKSSFHMNRTTLYQEQEQTPLASINGAEVALSTKKERNSVRLEVPRRPFNVDTEWKSRVYAVATNTPIPISAAAAILNSKIFLLRTIGSSYHWDSLDGPYSVRPTALGIDTGIEVLVGYADGAIFLVNVKTGASQDLTMAQDQSAISENRMQPSSNIKLRKVSRITGLADGSATDVWFALFQKVDPSAYLSQRSALGIYRPGTDPGFLDFPVPPRVTRIMGIEVAFDLATKQRFLFVTTDDSVWLQRLDVAMGRWIEAKEGLPMRPHCGDLRSVIVDGKTYLIMTTWGRSAWMTLLQQLDADTPRDQP
jgi:hypothetical protein